MMSDLRRWLDAVQMLDERSRLDEARRVKNHWGSGPAAQFLDAVTRWERQYATVMDRVHLELEKHGEAEVDIDSINVMDVKDRRQGLGTEVMLMLTEMADKFGVTLTLIPTAQDEDTPHLPDWYAGFGFRWNMGGKPGMIRQP